MALPIDLQMRVQSKDKRSVLCPQAAGTIGSIARQDFPGYTTPQPVRLVVSYSLYIKTRNHHHHENRNLYTPHRV